MAKKKKYATEEGMQNVEQALGRSEQFIERNQKVISIVFVAVIILVGIVWFTNKYYVQPQEDEALGKMFYAQDYFEKDSFNLAVAGNEVTLGFDQIADEYSSTNAGKLAKFYAAVCYVKLGEYDIAIDYLKGYSGEDEIITARARGVLGDAYMQNQEPDKAIKAYASAVELQNDVLTPAYLFKLGMAYESTGDYDNAIKFYTEIKEQYANSVEAYTIDKYLTRAKVLASEQA